MSADHLLLALLCAPSVTLVLIFVLLETYDKLIEIIAGILEVWGKKKEDAAIKEIEERAY